MLCTSFRFYIFRHCILHVLLLFILGLADKMKCFVAALLVTVLALCVPSHLQFDKLIEGQPNKYDVICRNASVSSYKKPVEKLKKTFKNFF